MTQCVFQCNGTDLSLLEVLVTLDSSSGCLRWDQEHVSQTSSVEMVESFLLFRHAWQRGFCIDYVDTAGRSSSGLLQSEYSGQNGDF